MKVKLLKLIRIAQLTISLFALVILCALAYECAVYLRTAPRFDLQKVSVSGTKHIDEADVVAAAGVNLGTNVFTVKLGEVRERIEEIPWVRHALVERALPDQIIIKIVEREAIGLARIKDDIYEFDADGTILHPEASAASFPVLDGMKAGDTKGNLNRVTIYQKVVQELGQASLSEVHISEAGEVTVVSASDPLPVSLGSTEFRGRWMKYLHLKPQIQQQYPQAVLVDLRFKNQVIVRMRDDATTEKIVWGEKKDTL